MLDDPKTTRNRMAEDETTSEVTPAPSAAAEVPPADANDDRDVELGDVLVGDDREVLTADEWAARTAEAEAELAARGVEPGPSLVHCAHEYGKSLREEDARPEPERLETLEVAELEREECAVAHLASPCPNAKPPRFRVGIKGFAVTTYRDAIGLDHDAPSPGRKQVRGEQVVIEAATAAAAREEFCRRFGVRSSSKPIKVSDA
jgi:hypothetical protein